MNTPTPIRNVRLYGKLGARFGRNFRLAVASPAEAVNALCKMVPGFERELMGSKDKGVGYAVLVGKRHIGREELRQVSGSEDIRIAPIVMGGKNGGFFNIILGAILVVVGVLITPFSGPLGAAVANFGWAMIVGGIVQLLTPTPKGNGSQDKEENRSSYTFNGPINTQAQGNCVPLLYGELFIGSAVISASIESKDQAYVPTPGAASGGANGASGGGASPVWWVRFVQDQEEA